MTHCAQSDKITLTIENNPCKNMGDILEKGDNIMTIAELHEILDDENRKITLKEYQEILYQLKWDTIEMASKTPSGQISAFQWYNGEMNGFHLALSLSEHIKEEQK